MNDQTPDLKGLKSFARQKDRQESPIFVGRERETDHILERAELVGEAHAEGRDTEGETVVITGCPGSGKSAFLGHFARTFGRSPLADTVLVPVRCNHEDLTARNSKELRAQLAELAIEQKAGMHRTFQALAEDLGQRLKLSNTFERFQQKVSEDADKRTVVCLLVDEIQNVTEASADAVQLLHTRAFSPPVLPVYAGLDNSVERLESVCGISRLAANAHTTMGTLPEHASKEAAELLFEKYRVRSNAATRDAWGQAIEKEALGFAQHLHVALQAACSVLVERAGTARVEDAPEVRHRAQAARESFYASKTSGIVHDHGKAVLDLVHQATRTNMVLTRPHLARWAKESMQKHSPLSREYSDEEAFALIERLRRRGILHLTEQGQAHVPIPSLRAWLTGPWAEHIGWRPERPGTKRDPETPGEH